MTSDEIRTIGRMTDGRTEAYLRKQSAAELRWQILIHRFQHHPTEPTHENSSPE